MRVGVFHKQHFLHDFPIFEFSKKRMLMFLNKWLFFLPDSQETMIFICLRTTFHEKAVYKHPGL